MEIKIGQEKLAKALNNVSRVAAGARATLPILSNVLMRVDGNKVTLTTTNLDMAVVSYLPVRRARPLMRRRFRTWRPDLVALRFIKPCSTLRWRLWG